MVTFTLSPALSWAEAAGDAVAAGVAAAGVAALGLFSLLLFAFSVLDSHAVKASASKAIAKIFIIMIVLPKYASERSIVQVSPVNVENRRNVSCLGRRIVEIIKIVRFGGLARSIDVCSPRSGVKCLWKQRPKTLAPLGRADCD